MTPFSIIRIKKLKSWGTIAGAAAHNARTRETPNADPADPCRFLIGSRTDDPVALCQARLGDRKIRKNAVYGVDGFLGASPEYFRPDAPGQYGLAYEDRLNAWVDASLAWLRSRYGDRIINAVLHLDEATPHIQYLPWGSAVFYQNLLTANPLRFKVRSGWAAPASRAGAVKKRGSGDDDAPQHFSMTSGRTNPASRTGTMKKNASGRDGEPLYFQPERRRLISFVADRADEKNASCREERAPGKAAASGRTGRAARILLHME